MHQYVFKRIKNVHNIILRSYIVGGPLPFNFLRNGPLQKKFGKPLLLNMKEYVKTEDFFSFFILILRIKIFKVDLSKKNYLSYPSYS